MGIDSMKPCGVVHPLPCGLDIDCLVPSEFYELEDSDEEVVESWLDSAVGKVVGRTNQGRPVVSVPKTIPPEIPLPDGRTFEPMQTVVLVEGEEEGQVTIIDVNGREYAFVNDERVK